MKNTIRVERAIKDITQQDLAIAVGVSRQTINSIESNRYVPSTILALKIARYFEKSVETIFILEDKDKFRSSLSITGGSGNPPGLIHHNIDEPKKQQSPVNQKKIHRGNIQNKRVIYFIASNSWSQILFIPLTEG